MLMVDTPEKNKYDDPLTSPISPADRRIADAYIKHLSYQKAGEEYGYSPKSARQSAYRRIRKPEVQEYIKDILRKEAESRKLTPEWIKEQIIDVVENEVEGNTKLRGLELLGKAVPGTFKEVDHQLPGGLFAVIGQLPSVYREDTNTIDIAQPVDPAKIENTTAPTSGEAPAPVEVIPDQSVGNFGGGVEGPPGGSDCMDTTSQKSAHHFEPSNTNDIKEVQGKSKAEDDDSIPEVKEGQGGIDEGEGK